MPQERQRELASLVVSRFNEETMSNWSAELLPAAATPLSEPIIECTIRWQYGVVTDDTDIEMDSIEQETVVHDGWVKLLAELLNSLDHSAGDIINYLAELIAEEIEENPKVASDVADTIAAMLGTDETLSDDD